MEYCLFARSSFNGFFFVVVVVCLLVVFYVIAVIFGIFTFLFADKRPLKNVIPPYSKNMAKMTAALNKSRQIQPIWTQLAINWGLPPFQIRRLDSLTPQSPIKKLIEWMLSRNVEMTTDQFLGMLEKIERFDVKELVEEEIYNAQKRRQSYQQPSTLSIPVQRQTSVSNQQGKCT